MSESEVKSHYPIQILVNYWDIHSSRLPSYLDELLHQGISRISSFIPWQFFESDISHSLQKFLQLAADRKIVVSLIPTPELGVHCQNSGLPKDLSANSDSIGRHVRGGKAAVHLPPKAFMIPSLFSEEFGKRYYSYLSRINVFLSDLNRSGSDINKYVELNITGSFWKYYRSPCLSSADPFSGITGDHSKNAAVVFRQCLEEFYVQREFADPDLSAANRWKQRSYEKVNKRWFFQQSEDVFRTRTTQVLKRKSLEALVKNIELFTPEADPAVHYSSLLQSLSGGAADFFRLSSLLDDYTTRSSSFEGRENAPIVHWTGLGGFRTLSDSERQFLILKSLMLMGSRSGAVLIDVNEWTRLSTSFKGRLEKLAETLSEDGLALDSKALYLASHLWSGGGSIWEQLRFILGFEARMVASVDTVLENTTARLLVVDPNTIIMSEGLENLQNWASKGRLLCLPKSSLYTEQAKSLLQTTCSHSNPLTMDLGISFQVMNHGDGKIVVYELPSGATLENTEILASWKSFLSSVCSLAELQSPCQISDSRLITVPFLRSRGDGAGLGLFVFNGTAQSIKAELIFSEPVSVGDLIGKQEQPVNPAKRFSLEIPPCGIVPLLVEGLDSDKEERYVATLESETMKRGDEEAAETVLPGFCEKPGDKNLWI